MDVIILYYLTYFILFCYIAINYYVSLIITNDYYTARKKNHERKYMLTATYVFH